MLIKELITCGWPWLFYLEHCNASIQEVCVTIASQCSGRKTIIEITSNHFHSDQWAALGEAFSQSDHIFLFSNSHLNFLSRFGNFLGDNYPGSFEWKDHSVDSWRSLQSNWRSKAIIVSNSLVTARGANKLRNCELSREDIEQADSQCNIEDIHFLRLGVDLPANLPIVDYRDLCLLHHRDSTSNTSERTKSMSENFHISWTNLQEKLRASPLFQAIDPIRDQLTDEQYSFAAAAILFLDKHDKEDFEAENYPDIYELVWELKGTSSKLFRGQRDASWPLDPTLLRRSPPQPLTFSEFSDRIRKTEEFVDYLRKHSEDYFHGAPSDMDLLAIAQHYGFSTQLLDFTESVEVAAFFATLQHDPKKTSKSSLGVIYSLPQDYDSRSDNIEDINIAESLSLNRGRPIVVSPPLHEKEHRIKRQKAKFITGHRGIDLYSAGLTVHVFRQIPGSNYEDAAKNISKGYLLEEESKLYKVAQCILRSKPAKSPASQLFDDITIRASALMTTLSQSSEPLIDRAQNLWTDIFDQLRTEYENDFAGRAKSILSEYFKLLQQRAESGFSIPIGKPYLTLRPLNASIRDIESHFDLPDGTIHALCGKHLVTVDSEAGFQLNKAIQAWSTKTRVGIAFGLLVKGIDQLQAGFELECNSTLRAGHFIMRSNLNRE